MICNPVTEELGAADRIVAQGEGAEATLAVMSERDSHAAEPPAAIAAAMLAADVVIAPTIQSLSHTAARKAASEAGARIATMPGVTEEMLARVMAPDMAELARRGEAICALLDRGLEARITCANGSDLRLGLEGRHLDRRRRRPQRTAAPSATCPAARGSSRRSRARPRGRSSSTARSPASAGSSAPGRADRRTTATWSTPTERRARR